MIRRKIASHFCDREGRYHWARVLILFLLFGALYFAWDFATDGFSLPKIQSSLTFDSKWERKENLEEATHILQMSFHYLSKGSQCFVFESEDGEYILKFFKHYRFRLHKAIEILPLPLSLDRKRAERRWKKYESFLDTFTSILYANDQFKDETALLYTHLNKGEGLPNELHLKDRIGRHFTIDPNNYEFVIQKKAQSVASHLLSFKQRGAHEKAKKAIVSLLDFVKMRREKGFNDKDPHLIKNFGFLGEKVIEIDLGGFYIDQEKDLSYFYSSELTRIQSKIIPWLEANYPDLVPYTLDQISLIKAEETIYQPSIRSLSFENN